MKIHVARLADTPPQPWRNGRGMTRELLAWPGPNDWRIRISVADIEADAPFSTYASVQRWFAVLLGSGVALTIAGTERFCRIGDKPFAFPGESPTSCRLLAGVSRDLNFMLRDAEGDMQKAEAGQAWQPHAQRCGLFTMGAGRCRVGESVIHLNAESLLWLDDAPEALSFERSDTAGDKPAWWMAASDRGLAS
jgi:environmental stress-induced protein Ves